MIIAHTCPFCYKIHFTEVDKTAYQKWQLGILLAQEAFPEMPDTEREQLISGVCVECQKSFIKKSKKG